MRDALICGAIAGAAPMLLQVFGFASTPFSPEPAQLVALAIKLAGGMFLGCFWVWLNRETERFKAFQLGIIAPTAIAALIAGNTFSNIKKSNDMRNQPDPQAQTSDHKAGAGDKTSLLDVLVSSAYADGPSPPPAKKGNLLEPGGFKKFLYALAGGGDDGWFVITGSYTSEREAEKHRDELKSQGWDARVGDPAALWGGYYPVIIGQYLTQDRAIALRDFARQSGLAEDTYAWRH